MITVFGGLALLAGFIMLYMMTGTNTITELLQQRHHISQQPLFIPAMLLMLMVHLQNQPNSIPRMAAQSDGSAHRLVHICIQQQW